jgi:LacI family transcriptional regulator
VAREAGTSTATVSYVINGGPRRVSPERTRRILEAIRKLDYRPNRVARALRREKTGLFGLVLPDATLPFFGSLAKAVEEEVFARDGLVLIGNTGFAAEPELAITHAFLDSKVDGLVLVAEHDDPALDTVLAGSGTRYVWAHYRPTASSAPAVVSDHLAAGRLAAEHLSRHARRRTLFVGGQAGHGVVALREEGWRQVVAAGGFAGVLRTDLTPRMTYEMTRAALLEDPTVDGLVVGTYGQAKAAMSAVLDLGVRIATDVALVTFDGDDKSTFERPRLASVQQEIQQLARVAVGIVLGERPVEGVMYPHVLPVRLVPADSCGCTVSGGRGALSRRAGSCG